MTRKSAFPPIFRPDARILILGSLPSDASLAAGHYYAHPRNAFWPLLSELTGTPFGNASWEERYALVQQHGIALWDVVASGVRPGSLDQALRDVATAELSQLISKLPALTLVAFNGQTAAKLGAPQLSRGLGAVTLPSSSPAHTMPFADKLAHWQVITPHLLIARP
ncbi:DNA-deoxyinosine glycosylase [Chitinibacteraceae bacterium HSL-7]